MKRLSNCHRKTPVHKEDKCPDFYELAKTSPLPDMSLTRGGSAGTAAAVATPSGQLSALSGGLPGQTAATVMGSVGGAGQMQQVLSLLANDAASRSPNLAAAAAGLQQASLPRLAQLQRDNEDLRRRIMEMENMQQAQRMIGNQQRVPDQLASLSANIAGAMGGAPAPTGAGNSMLERFMMQSNNAMNNSINANSLLSALGGAVAGNAAAGVPNASEFSFMTNFPRDQMLLRAMRPENQVPSSSSSNVSPLELVLQQNNTNPTAGPVAAPLAGAPAGMTAAQVDGNRAKAMLEWMAKQQQQGQGPL